MILVWRRTNSLPVAPVQADATIADWGFGASGVGVRFTYDPDFLAGLAMTAAVQADARAGGNVVGRYGSAGPPDWQTVPGLEALPCCLAWKKSIPVEGAAHPSMMRTGVCLFGQSLPAGRGHRLVVNDQDYETIYAYLTAEVRDAHQNQGHHWECDVIDRPLS